ncbi:MAG: hypothetical protein ACYTJ0_19510, partial [Planctomycetota bacterium]
PTEPGVNPPGAAVAAPANVGGDYQITITGDVTVPSLPGRAPVFEQPTAPACGSTFDWAAGKELAFDLVVSDGDPGDVVTLEALFLPAGATLDPALPVDGNPVQSSFSWTPTQAQEGPQIVAFRATDAGGHETECSFTVNVKFDSDGDGLPDLWETPVAQGGGYTHTNGQLVDLYAMGARPDHKDVFVEIDTMEGITPPLTAGLDLVVASFAAAPVSNPDGLPGITLHCFVDDVVPFDALLGTGDVTSYDWTEFDAIKAVHFAEELEWAFHYCVFANETSAANSGISRGIEAGDFIVSLGAFPQGGTVWQHAGTFMHELGHNLGLGHGGFDDVDGKPNYLSIMNRNFQLQGLRMIDGNGGAQDGVFDYSRQRIDLDERAINESLGLGAAAPSSYATTWFRYDTQLWTTDEGASDGPVTGAVDWNNDGFILTVAIPIDVTDDGATTLLEGHDDWATLSFTGGRLGGGVALPLPQVTEVGDELTLEEAQQLGIAPPTKVHGRVDDEGQKIVLTWKPVGPRKEASYRIRRGIGEAAPVLIGSTDNSNYEDADLVAGTTYTYLVSVVNALGVESTRAAIVRVTFAD